MSCTGCAHPGGNSPGPRPPMTAAAHTPGGNGQGVRSQGLGPQPPLLSPPSPSPSPREPRCWGSQPCSHFALVAAYVEAPVQGHNPHCLLLPWLRHDGVTTHRAAGGEFPVGSEGVRGTAGAGGEAGAGGRVKGTGVVGGGAVGQD